jgi:hypothetical protein
MSKKVAILDVPEPTNVEFNYAYDLYAPDESFVPNLELRRFILTGVLPQLNTVPVGITRKDLTREEIEVKIQRELDETNLENVLNFEESLRIEDTIVFSNDLREIKKDALSVLSEWALERGLRGDPVSLFAEETGLSFAGFENDEFREGYIAAEIPARFSGSATEGLLGNIQDIAQKDEILDEESFWRIVSAAPPQTPLFVSRLGLWIEGFRKPMWKVADPERLRPRVFLLGPSPEFNLTLEALHGYENKFSVRGLYLLTLLDPNESERPENKKRFFALCASRPRLKTLESFVYERPSPPLDLAATWDYDQSALRLRWNHPFDPKNVIKRVQLLKRLGPDEPYTLLREWDWNDNQVDWPREGREEIPRGLVKRERPLGWFYDINFKSRPGSLAHYALATTTTHGVSSTYSIQITTRWLNAQKGVVNSLLSRSGAPKAYPNLLLENNAARREGITSDVLKVNGVGALQIFFDPETTKVEGEAGEELRDYRKNKWLISTLQHETLESDWLILSTEEEKLVLGKKAKSRKKVQ